MIRNLEKNKIKQPEESFAQERRLFGSCSVVYHFVVSRSGKQSPLYSAPIGLRQVVDMWMLGTLRTYDIDET